MDEVERELQRPVVQRLIRLIRFRNEYDAFDGAISRPEDFGDSVLALSWERGQSKCRLTVDFQSNKALIRYADDDGNPADYPL